MTQEQTELLDKVKKWKESSPTNAYVMCIEECEVKETRELLTSAMYKLHKDVECYKGLCTIMVLR
jgi:hypothetical protein